MSPDTAFILAAGFGKRLRPHTEHTPKPMVKVGGKPMIDHALDALLDAGVTQCVVNTHYKADILYDHLGARNDMQIWISHEDQILDTGGGLKNGLTQFKPRPESFFVLSGDSVWQDAPNNKALPALAKAWDPNKMDILMLLQPVSTMTLTKGVGDYDLDNQGRATRSLNQSGEYMFTSIRINKTAIFDDAPDGPFSYLTLMDKAEKQGRLYGLVHHGDWHHISTPDDLVAVNEQYVGA